MAMFDCCIQCRWTSHWGIPSSAHGTMGQLPMQILGCSHGPWLLPPGIWLMQRRTRWRPLSLGPYFSAWKVMPVVPRPPGSGTCHGSRALYPAALQTSSNHTSDTKILRANRSSHRDRENTYDIRVCMHLHVAYTGKIICTCIWVRYICLHFASSHVFKQCVIEQSVEHIQACYAVWHTDIYTYWCVCVCVIICSCM